MNRTTRIEKLEQLYAELPKVACQRKCADSCGPIGMTQLEARRMRDAAGGRELTLGAAAACSLLQAGACSVYAVRPLICRLYGVIPALRCEHGCEPDRWLSDDEVVALMRRVRELGGDDVVTAPYEVRQYLRELNARRYGRAAVQFGVRS